MFGCVVRSHSQVICRGGRPNDVQQERLHLGVRQLDRPRAQRQAGVLLARAGGEVERVGQLLRRQPLAPCSGV